MSTVHAVHVVCFDPSAATVPMVSNAHHSANEKNHIALPRYVAKLDTIFGLINTAELLLLA